MSHLAKRVRGRVLHLAKRVNDRVLHLKKENMFKNLLRFLPLLAIAAVLSVSCSKDDALNDITSISFVDPPAQLIAGDKRLLETAVGPENIDASYTLAYSSSDRRVATVSSLGTVAAVAAGQTVITVTVKEQPQISASFTLTVSPVRKAPRNTRFRKVVYYPSYRDLANIPDRNLKMADVACFAFASINQDYTLTVEKPDKLRALAARCKRLGVKIVISFAGHGHHAIFVKMTAQPKHRDTFIRSLREIVETYDLDGVDNDWEFPRTTDGSDAGNTALMRELSAWLHDPAVDKLLTMSIASGEYRGAIASAIQDECFDYVDWFNIMCYDNYLGWADKTPAPDPLEMLTIAYDYWVGTRRVPKWKFVGGISTYGRPSDEQNNGKAFSFATILAQGGDPDGYVATVSTSSYTGPVYYNGRPFVRQKTRYCIDQGVGGIMFWEAGHDSQDERSLIRAACDEADGYADLP